ncbi:Uncharacterised protein [Bordetella ansorpii]|uniref:Uncharacterized protein n=1 Tax=Bordetella ansorpii TaxID=288768 RepID=A0A157SRQ2_9BORD|nr:hypothetical protein [Bordetella ansorpii]SAI73107.1 Uncharacterised protein [Bordetella ansorpii]
MHAPLSTTDPTAGLAIAVNALDSILRQSAVPFIHDIARAALDRLQVRPAGDNLVRVIVAFERFNPRRYGQPWIARVIRWPLGKRCELSFGIFLGSASGGDGEILARPGDIIRWGQRDHRGRHTWARWGIAQQDGSVQLCAERDARRVFRV